MADEREVLVYRINEFLEVRFIGGRTYIYVNDKRVLTCAKLLFNISSDKIDIYDRIDSIDEIDELYKQNKNFSDYKINISEHQEFRGHCSNLQVWAENDYDTRLLHMNIAFPLLKKLAEAGDQVAKKKFKDEIAKRFNSNHLNVVLYLADNGYLDYLNEVELDSLIKRLEGSLGSIEEHLMLAILYEKMELYGKVFELYAQIYNLDSITESQQRLLWENIGNLYYKKKLFRSAIKSYKQALNKKPDSITLLFRLGESYYEIEKYHNAQRMFSKCIKLDNENLDSYIMLAEIYFDNESIDNSLDMLEKALEIQPNSLLVKCFIGQCLYSKGDYEIATRIAEEILEIDCNYEKALCLLGNIYDSIENYKGAINTFTKIRIKCEHCNCLWFNLGHSYHYLGEYEKSIQSYERILEIDINNIDALSCKGIIHEEIGEHEKAQETFNRVINIDPTNDIAKYFLDFY